MDFSRRFFAAVQISKKSALASNKWGVFSFFYLLLFLFLVPTGYVSLNDAYLANIHLALLFCGFQPGAVGDFLDEVNETVYVVCCSVQARTILVESKSENHLQIHQLGQEAKRCSFQLSVGKHKDSRQSRVWPSHSRKSSLVFLLHVVAHRVKLQPAMYAFLRNASSWTPSSSTGDSDPG